MVTQTPLGQLMSYDSLYKQFPFLSALKSEIEAERPGKPQIAKIPKGHVIFEAGDPCRVIPFILSGEIRVFALSESGREMTLYRINPGESCILSISSLMAQSAIPAIAQAETDITALVVTADRFYQWMNRFEVVRGFAYGLMASMLAMVISTVDEVAFRRLDERIIEFLKKHQLEGKVSMTHQHIAIELGSSREVVSRILKDFEHRGLVELARGQITLLSTDL